MELNEEMNRKKEAKVVNFIGLGLSPKYNKVPENEPVPFVHKMKIRF